MAERVKVFEEKKGLPIWAWLLPLLLLLALLAYFLLNRHPAPNASAGPSAAPVAAGTVADAGAAATATDAAATSKGFPDLGTVHFETDKATLTPEGEATLQQAAGAMKANPGAHLRLEGYADSTGTAPHNLTLSEQRAATVVSFLQQQGIDRSRLTGEGFGAAKPLDTNTTEQGKADNRRVELFSQQ